MSSVATGQDINISVGDSLQVWSAFANEIIPPKRLSAYRCKVLAPELEDGSVWRVRWSTGKDSQLTFKPHCECFFRPLLDRAILGLRRAEKVSLWSFRWLARPGAPAASWHRTLWPQSATNSWTNHFPQEQIVFQLQVSFLTFSAAFLHVPFVKVIP